MRAFDAELYLRLMGERMLSGGRGDEGRGPRRPTIAEAAAALVAVEAIDAPCAESVLEDYSFAATLRSDPQFRRRGMVTASLSPTPSEAKILKPRRVVPCRSTIEQAQATMQVRYVSFSEDSTSVAVTWRPASAGPWAGGPPGAALTDDRGTTETAPFSGGGSGQGMWGRLTTARPLAADTAWIEIDGNRLVLNGVPSGFEATLERLPVEDPAHQYLWQRVAEPREFNENGLEPAIDALVAAGALSPSDPTLDEVRTVLQTLRAIPGLAASSAAKRVPEPWQSLIAAHGRDDGPRGSLVLGAVPPSFDGFSVAVLDLESDENRFRVDVEVSPALGQPMPLEWGIGPRQLAWWARDDRGNHYLGRRGYWTFREDFGHGAITFDPALDPRARKLELMPTAQTMRAVISFPLPWMAAP